MRLEGWEAYLAWRHEYQNITDPLRYPVEWLDEQIATAQISAWACPTAGMLARVETYPTGASDVHCMAAAGAMAGIMELRPIVEDWGRQQGCLAAVVESRPGWQRALREFGYNTHQICLRRELSI